MTALKQYERLESGGLWRPEPDAQRRDVTVSFGDATLVLTDTAGRPLTHWSLAAVERLNAGTRPALFAPDADASETLEIEDDLMVDAIEKVRKSLLRARPRPRRLRHLTTVVLVGAALALGVFWLPGALRDQAAAVVPLSKRSEIGATLLGHLQRASGPVCRGSRGTAALRRLHIRLFGQDAAGQIVVMPLENRRALILPGGIVVIDSDLVQTVDDPAVIAGYAVLARSTSRETDPLSHLLEYAPLSVTARLLTTSDIETNALQDYASQLDRPALWPAEGEIWSAFDASNVTTVPFARHAANDTTSLDRLLTDDPVAGRETPPVMSDQDWVGLQGICDA